MIELIEATFGKLVLEKNERLEEFTSDVVIHTDGRITKRAQEQVRSLSKRRIGEDTSHAIWKEEIDWEFGEETVDTIFVGTGMNGMLKVPDETIDLADELGAHIVEDSTPRIISRYNKAKGRKAAILHLTC